jgi:hypothetical protein
MHFTSSPAVKSKKNNVQTRGHASGILVYPVIYWALDILVYTVTYHPIPPCTLTPNLLPQNMFLMLEHAYIYLSTLHHILQSKLKKNHCADHASDILGYTSISKYILVYTVSYFHTLPFTLNQALSALRLRRVSAPRFSRASLALVCLTVVCV